MTKGEKQMVVRYANNKMDRLMNAGKIQEAQSLSRIVFHAEHDTITLDEAMREIANI